MNFTLYIPYVNRGDLLDKAIVSAKPAYASNIVLIDNSNELELSQGWDGRFEGLEVLTPPVPLSCTQTLNWMKRDSARRQHDVFFWLHNDAEIPTGVGEEFLAFVRRTWSEDPKFGVVYTNYDAFCAFNLAAVVAIGDWDQHLTQYFSDNDYYHRMRQAGFKTIASGLHVHHVSSATLNSDPVRQMANRHFFPAAQGYCREKHGGDV